MVARSHREMQWTEGWANEDALLSALDRRTGEALVSPLERSFSEDESSVAPSHEMDDTDDGLKERLSAVADSLAFPQNRSIRDALREGEELYDEGARLWEEQQKERAGAAFLRSITVCQDALGDALDSMEEEELEALIALSEKQLTLAREQGWATHDDDTGAGLPPAQTHAPRPGRVDPFAPNGGSYEDDYDQEDFEGSGDEGSGDEGWRLRTRPQSVGMDFPVTVTNSTADRGSNSHKSGRARSSEMPWPPSLEVTSSGARSRSTEPRLQSGKTLEDGWKLMERGGAAFDERDFDQSGFAGERDFDQSGIAYRPHSMYDSLRSSASRSDTGWHKANARAYGVYSDLSVVRMALGGPPPAAASLPAAAALERPSERPAGGGQASNRRREGRFLPSPESSPRGPRTVSETEISVARSTAHLLERSVEDLCPELVTPRRKGWVPVRPKCSPSSHTPLQASTLRTTHGGTWSVLNYQTRHNLRHPRSTVNAFRTGTPSALSRTIPRRAVRQHANMYAESRPWRNGLYDEVVDDPSRGDSGGNSSSQLKEDQRQILFTMADITRDAEAAAKLKLQKRAQKMKEFGRSASPPRAGTKGRRNVSPQKSGKASERRLKRARELKQKRDAQKKQLESVATEFSKVGGDGDESESKIKDDAAMAEMPRLRPRTSGSFSVQWNDKLERALVEERQQKAKFLMQEGLTEEEHVKNKVSPYMGHLARLATNAKRNYDENAVKVKPMACVLGAVAVTDSGLQRGATGAQKKQAAAAEAYVQKIQEILDRAKDRQKDDVDPSDRGENNASGDGAAATVVEMTMPESSALLQKHPGASERGAAFGRIEQAERCMAMVNRGSLLANWPSDDVKLKAGNSGWDSWRPEKGMIGEVLHHWDWDQGVWLLKIAAQPGGGPSGAKDVVDRYCVMPKNACASVRVLGMQATPDWAADENERQDQADQR